MRRDMLQGLRNLGQESKRKVALVLAGTLTFFVFVFWILNFFGIFVSTMNSVVIKGASAYSAFELNVEKVYNTMTETMPKKVFGNQNTNTLQDTATTTEGI